MSTARIQQRLIKPGSTELGLEGLSREELMNALGEQMIKEELSVSEEEEKERWVVLNQKKHLNKLLSRIHHQYLLVRR